MKIPDFPREILLSGEAEALYNWCYALYLYLKEEEKNEQEASLSDDGARV